MNGWNINSHATDNVIISGSQSGRMKYKKSCKSCKKHDLDLQEKKSCPTWMVGGDGDSIAEERSFYVTFVIEVKIVVVNK